ncbi:MAG TPA: MaoC/PaaZ C-terminal domain-containing protein [Thermoleophilaceae bacterium]|nr:MaoC/PaaZ C-terminal domain-containing protein [Thermoleophilaceae bacterium]
MPEAGTAVEARELSEAPSLGKLYGRALAGSAVSALGAVPGSRALGRVPGLGRLRRPSGRPELPATELVLASVTADRDRLAAYDRLCGFRLRDELPATYPHLLAFPMSVELMTDPAFPFGVLGLVHVRNRITQRRQIRLHEPLTLRARADALEPHERGTQFDMLVEATVDGERVWEGRSTYLRREGGGSRSSDRHGEAEETPRPSATWTVPADIGRRYAAVSGDRNPIHLHPLTARLLGMKRPIAHGMWLKARCLGALEGTLPVAYSVDVRFKLPLPLPSRVAFSSREERGHRSFAVLRARDGAPHLLGAVEGLA